MSKIALSGNASGTGTLTIAAPNTNSDRTLTLPDNTGTVITTASTFAGTGPAFSAYPTTGTSLTNGTWTKVNFQAEEFDTNSNFDTSTSRFTPTVAGYYQFNWTAGTPVNAEKMARIYKNGSSVKGGSDLIGFISSGSALLFMNGSTDYAEIYLVQVTGSTQTSYTGLDYGFSGALVRAA